MSSSKEKSPIKAELSARAEAKLEVTATVPESSVGRVVDAVTDVFRPFSESRGLKADQIRLQREDVAIEIAKKTRARLAIENAEIRQVPNKVLIPLIEAASNEEISDGYMLDLWANLLASASTCASVEPRFVGILRELNGKQAQAFERLALNNSAEFDHPLDVLADTQYDLDHINIRQTVKELKNSISRVDDLFDEISQLFDRPGAIAVDVIINYMKHTWSFDIDNIPDDPSEFQLNLDILESLGLCRYVTDQVVYNVNLEILVFYYHITNLGFNFFLSCQGKKDI